MNNKKNPFFLILDLSKIRNLSKTQMTMDEIGGMTQDLSNFNILYMITQLIGVSIVILMGSWVGLYLDGLAWTSNPKLQFNWHPIMMSIGMIFLYGNCNNFYYIYKRCAINNNN